MSLVKAMATVGGLTGVSRVAGFARDIMTASFLGAGPLADAFFVALKLPNFFRHITAEGALSISFVPLYTATRTQDGEAEASLFAGQTMSVMLMVLSIFSIIMMAAMPWVIYAIAPGFDSGTAQYEQAVTLSRIMFPYLFFMSFCALLGGILNAHNKFAPFAAAPIFFNLCQIAALLLSDVLFETAGHALAWGIALSGLVQFVWLFWFLRRYRIQIKLTRPRLTPRIKRLFKLMGPGVLGAGIIHVNLFADIIIASLLPVGAISALYYAERLFQLPLGVIGIAVGTALLPMLSKALAAKETDEARDLFNRALEYSLFFAVPAAVALMLIAEPIITVLFQHGAYTEGDKMRTVPALICLALGLPGYVGVKIFSSAYWSRQDTKTPVKIAAVMAVVNIVVALVLTRFMDVAGIALATGMAGWVQCYFLWRGLRGVEAVTFDARLRKNGLYIFLSAGLMAVCLMTLTYVLRDYFEADKVQQVLALATLIGGGAIPYFGAAHFCGIFTLKDFRKYFKRRKRV